MRERVKKRDRAVMVLGLIFVWLCESLDFEHTRQHKKWSERVEKNEKQIPYLNFVNQIILVILFFSRVILIVDLLKILFMEIYFLLKYCAFLLVIKLYMRFLRLQSCLNMTSIIVIKSPHSQYWRPDRV
jgi:hypothetical protein